MGTLYIISYSQAMVEPGIQSGLGREGNEAYSVHSPVQKEK